MSKIKTNRLEPRATNGSLTIGNPESYTTFEGQVVIPGYAAKNNGQITADVIDTGPNAAGYLKFDGEERVRWSGGMVYIYKILHMRGNTIQDVGDPVYSEDATNKQYVDDKIATLEARIAALGG